MNLNALVRDMAGLLEVALGRRARLIFDFAPDLPQVAGSVPELREVVMTLITGAVEALGEHGGEVTLQTDRRTLNAGDVSGPSGPLEAGEYAVLAVGDRGTTLPAEAISRIFEPTGKFEGRALSLSEVLRVVGARRGAMQVTSTPGHGNTVTILLPASVRPGPAASAHRPASDNATAAQTVLVIDDEELICFTTRHLLEASGFRALTATSGASGLALMDENTVDAVLLDLTMPDLSTERILATIEARFPATKVVVMSGYDEQEQKARSGAVQVAAFLPKPFTLEQLNGTLGVALKKPL